MGARRAGAWVEPARGLAELLDPDFRPLFFAEPAFDAELPFDAEPLLLLVFLVRVEPRPPLVVRLAMPHTVSVSVSAVTSAAVVSWLTIFR